MKRLIFLNCFLLFFIGLKVNAQTKRNYETNPERKRANNWLYGDKIWIDFNSNPAKVKSGSQMSTLEPASSYSDTAGNLLFYSNGLTVWNKNHNIVLNGSGLNGDNSSSQGVLFVKNPFYDSIIYLFTTDDQCGPKGLQVSTISLHSNIDSSIIIEKNRILIAPVCESISATQHQNGRNTWVTVHSNVGNTFYNYLVTPEGISPCPVVSRQGVNYNGDVINCQTASRFSSNGKYFAITMVSDFKVLLYDFNNNSGVFSFKNKFDNMIIPTGIAFSANDLLLYIVERDRQINQISILTGQSSVAKQINNQFKIKDLEKSPFGSILANVFDSSFISCVLFPDSLGLKSEYKQRYLYLNGNKGKSGLCNFNQSYFYTPSVDFAYNYNCLENTILFEGRDTFYADTFKWLAKKVFGSQNYSSNSKKTVITFSDTGLYNVIFIAKNGSRSDSVYKQILISPKINKDFLGKDTIYKSNIPFRLVLNTPANMHCISWQDSSTSPSLTIDTAGFYFVSITNKAFCTVYDTILVSRCENSLPKPTLRLNNDTLITSSTAADSIKWFKNGKLIKTTKDTFIVLSETGTYIVTLSKNNFCNSSSNPFNYTCLFGLKDPLLRLIKDTLIVSQIDADSFAWFKNNTQIKISNDSILLPNDTGIFKVAAFKGNYCQSNSNSIYIKCIDRLIKPTLRISKDTLFALSNSVDSFIWYKNGQIIYKNIDSFIVLTDTGYYRLEAFKHKYCLTSSSSFYVSCIDKLATPIIRQNRDSLFVTGVQADSFVWFKNGKELITTKTLQIKINDTGLYRVEARKNKYCNRISPILLVTKLNVKLANKNDDTFRIYPSPASTEINVKIFNANSDNISIQIFDAAGKQHFQQNYMSQNNSLSTKVDLANLSSGIYTVYIQELNYYYKLVVIK